MMDTKVKIEELLNGKKELTIFEKLHYSTVKIECLDLNGDSYSGSGFIMDFEHINPETHIKPVLITNKHVLEDISFIKILFCTQDINGNVSDIKHHCIEFINSDSDWFMHPDDDVDLCALPLVQHILRANECYSDGTRVYCTPLSINLLPSIEQLEQLDAFEQLIVIGYPNGLWDEINNKPIQRHGITATHITKDYRGFKQFLIDSPCYLGSSGSPVFLLNKGTYSVKGGELMYGNRVLLLGVVYAIHQVTVSGDIEIIDIPTTQATQVNSEIPMNLGVVIKSERIRELIALFDYP